LEISRHFFIIEQSPFFVTELGCTLGYANTEALVRFSPIMMVFRFWWCLSKFDVHRNVVVGRRLWLCGFAIWPIVHFGSVAGCRSRFVAQYNLQPTVATIMIHFDS